MAKKLERKIRAIRRRLQWIEFCRRLIMTGALLTALAGLFLLVTRLFVMPVGLRDVLPWAAGGCAIMLIAWTWMGRVRLFEAALRADDALGLKERLSSALTLGEPANEPEAAVLEDATSHAEGIRPSETFAIDLTREARWAVAPIAVLVIAWFLPQFDLLAKVKEADEKRNPAIKIEARKQAAASLEELAKEIAEAGEARDTKMAGAIEREIDAIAKQLTEQKIETERAAAKLQNLSDKLGRNRAELEKKLKMPSDLASRGTGKWTGELAKQMQKGNFDKAAKALKEMKKKLADGKLSEEEKAGLQKELAMLSAALDPDSPLAESLSQAALKLEAGDMNSALGAFDDALGEMLDLESILAELKALEGLDYDMDARLAALLGEGGLCEYGECQGLALGDGFCEKHGHGAWRPGSSRNYGNGMGGPGIGRGQIAGSEAGPAGFTKTRPKSDVAPGKIIAKMKVPGSQAPGEVTVAYEELRLEYAQKAEDTISKDVLPLEHRARVRQYFDAIKGHVDEPESEASEQN